MKKTNVFHVQGNLDNIVSRFIRTIRKTNDKEYSIFTILRLLAFAGIQQNSKLAFIDIFIETISFAKKVNKIGIVKESIINAIIEYNVGEKEYTEFTLLDIINIISSKTTTYNLKIEILIWFCVYNIYNKQDVIQFIKEYNVSK